MANASNVKELLARWKLDNSPWRKAVKDIQKLLQQAAEEDKKRAAAARAAQEASLTASKKELDLHESLTKKTRESIDLETSKAKAIKSTAAAASQAVNQQISATERLTAAEKQKALASKAAFEIQQKMSQQALLFEKAYQAQVTEAARVKAKAAALFDSAYRAQVAEVRRVKGENIKPNTPAAVYSKAPLIATAEKKSAAVVEEQPKLKKTLEPKPAPVIVQEAAEPVQPKPPIPHKARAVMDSEEALGLHASPKLKTDYYAKLLQNKLQLDVEEATSLASQYVDSLITRKPKHVIEEAPKNIPEVPKVVAPASVAVPSVNTQVSVDAEKTINALKTQQVELNAKIEAQETAIADRRRSAVTGRFVSKTSQEPIATASVVPPTPPIDPVQAAVNRAKANAAEIGNALRLEAKQTEELSIQMANGIQEAIKAAAAEGHSIVQAEADFNQGILAQYRVALHKMKSEAANAVETKLTVPNKPSFTADAEILRLKEEQSIVNARLIEEEEKLARAKELEALKQDIISRHTAQMTAIAQERAAQMQLGEETVAIMHRESAEQRKLDLERTRGLAAARTAAKQYGDEVFGVLRAQEAENARLTAREAAEEERRHKEHLKHLKEEEEQKRERPSLRRLLSGPAATIAGAGGGTLGRIAGSLVGGLEIGAGIFAFEELEKGLDKIVDKVKEFIEDSGGLQKVSETFQNLAAGKGYEGGEFLEELVGKTHHLVSEVDLLRVANTFMQSGLKVSKEDMLELTEATVGLARGQGKDATQAVQALTRTFLTGGRGAMQLARVVGIQGPALMMRGFGATTTMAQRQQATFENLAKVIKKRYEEMGQPALTYTDRLKQVQVVSTELYEKLAQGAVKSPGFATMMASFGEAIDKMGGLESAAEHLGEKIGNAVSPLATVFSELQPTIGAITNAFSQMFTVLEDLFSLISQGTATDKLGEDFARLHPILDMTIKSLATIALVISDMAHGVAFLGQTVDRFASTPTESSDEYKQWRASQGLKPVKDKRPDDKDLPGFSNEGAFGETESETKANTGESKQQLASDYVRFKAEYDAKNKRKSYTDIFYDYAERLDKDEKQFHESIEGPEKAYGKFERQSNGADSQHLYSGTGLPITLPEDKQKTDKWEEKTLADMKAISDAAEAKIAKLQVQGGKQPTGEGKPSAKAIEIWSKSLDKMVAQHKISREQADANLKEFRSRARVEHKVNVEHKGHEANTDEAAEAIRKDAQKQIEEAKKANAKALGLTYKPPAVSPTTTFNDQALDRRNAQRFAQEKLANTQKHAQEELEDTKGAIADEAEANESMYKLGQEAADAYYLHKKQLAKATLDATLHSINQEQQAQLELLNTQRKLGNITAADYKEKADTIRTDSSRKRGAAGKTYDKEVHAAELAHQEEIARVTKENIQNTLKEKLDALAIEKDAVANAYREQQISAQDYYDYQIAAVKLTRDLNIAALQAQIAENGQFSDANIALNARIKDFAATARKEIQSLNHSKIQIEVQRTDEIKGQAVQRIEGVQASYSSSLNTTPYTSQVQTQQDYIDALNNALADYNRQLVEAAQNGLAGSKTWSEIVAKIQQTNNELDQQIQKQQKLHNAGTLSGQAASLAAVAGPAFSNIFGGRYARGLEGALSNGAAAAEGAQDQVNEASSGFGGIKDAFKKGSITDVISDFGKGLRGAISAVGSFANAIANAGSASAGAAGGAIAGGGLGNAVGDSLGKKGGPLESLGAFAGPAGALVGGALGAMTGALFGQKQEEVQDDINQLSANFKRIMNEYSSNNQSLNQTISNLTVLIAQAQAMQASTKKGGSQFTQLIQQYNEQIVQLQNQQKQIMTQLNEQLTVATAPIAFQNIVSGIQDILKQYTQFVGAARDANDLANANTYLAQSMQNLAVTYSDQLNQGQQQAIQDALDLNNLYNERNQLEYQYIQQVMSIRGQGTLTRGVTLAQSKFSQLYNLDVQHSQQLNQINSQIALEQYKVSAAQQIFTLSTTQVGLQTQLLALQKVGINEDMQRLNALQTTLAMMKSTGYNLTNLSSLNPSDPNAMLTMLLSLLANQLGVNVGGTNNPTGTPYGIATGHLDDLAAGAYQLRAQFGFGNYRSSGI